MTWVSFVSNWVVNVGALEGVRSDIRNSNQDVKLAGTYFVKGAAPVSGGALGI